MSIFSKLFRKTNKTLPDEYEKLVSFLDEFNGLLSLDKFIARSDYAHLIDKYNDIYIFYKNDAKADTLGYYCKANRLDIDMVTDFLNAFADISDLARGSTTVKKHNEAFIRSHLKSEKQYLDKILDKIDPDIKLDEEQRRVVLSDEDHTLVIAGAGAGKTTTLAAKVRYLVERRNIDPKQILVISFTNKAVGELRERINEQLSIPCPITTFHQTGNAILHKQDVVKKRIVTEGFLYKTVNEYLKGSVLEKPDLVDKLILFFGSYFDAPYEGNDINEFFNYISKSDFTTLKSNLNEYNEEIIDRKSRKSVTITNETLRSIEEVRIANFLYLNQIDYVYEEEYPYHIVRAKKPYTPDFCIRQGEKVAYIEHFGITECGESNLYTKEQLESYKRAIREKIALHRAHGTTLIYTFSSYNDGIDLLEHLERQLEYNGFLLKKRPAEEVFRKLVNTEENKYIMKFVKLVCSFINNFKTNGYTLETFYSFERSNANVRSKLFFEICKDCYMEYQRKLSEYNGIDFQDMINDAARILREKRIGNEKLDFKYIIVDEYQDISKQRFDLTKELSQICNAKIIAVGDDWQSIFAFSGSDITLFTKFRSIMGYADELKITMTYRNAKEVIDIAGNFIQKNSNQIKKNLDSPKHIQKPLVIYTYSENADRETYKGRGGKYYLLGKKVEEAIGKIMEINKSEGKGSSSILLIGRFGFDARNLCYSNDFVYNEENNRIISKKYLKAKLEFLTAHSSKGLGYDNVIIVNARNDIYGFPSKIADDPIMKYVTKDDSSIEYAEERRLFYVAMTRTKNRVFIVTPEQRPSEFILELINDYPDITLVGPLNKDRPLDKGPVNRCPYCGFPMQIRYNKNYGLKLWICTNEPEICSFITNDPSGGKLSIRKCDRCKDGYLIVKRSRTKDINFLGCTNYKADNTGCMRTMSSSEFFAISTDDEFETDISADLPSFYTDERKELPKLKESNIKINTEMPKSDVHRTDYVEKFIEQDGFQIIVDNEGNYITDMELLSELRALRSKIGAETFCPLYKIINNKGLVSLATYRPSTKDEFVSLYGLGERSYALHGREFIEAIKEYEKGKDR